MQYYLNFYQFCYCKHFKYPPFLKSCVTILHSNVFAGPESNISNHYANQNLYLQNILLERRSKETPYMNHLGKNLQLLL